MNKLIKSVTLSALLLTGFNAQAEEVPWKDGLSGGEFKVAGDPNDAGMYVGYNPGYSWSYSCANNDLSKLDSVYIFLNNTSNIAAALEIAQRKNVGKGHKCSMAILIDNVAAHKDGWRHGEVNFATLLDDLVIFNGWMSMPIYFETIKNADGRILAPLSGKDDLTKAQYNSLVDYLYLRGYEDGWDAGPSFNWVFADGWFVSDFYRGGCRDIAGRKWHADASGCE